MSVPTSTRRRKYTPEQREAWRIVGARAMRRYRATWMRMVHDAKKKPCIDCGRDDLPPEVMELDHVRGEKAFEVSQPHGVRCVDGKTRLQMLEDEIAKCDPRCPTCHRLRHYEAQLEPVA